MADITGLPPNLLLDPAFLGSLQNTLTPAGVMSQMQAAFDEMQKSAAKHTSEAADAAAQAGRQYQTAAAAPPADVSPMESLVNSSLGNLASVISGEKGYSARAREDTQNQRRTLMQARMDNLAALKSNYEKKAAALEAAGHDEEALKTRLSIEKVSKQYDMMSKEQGQTFAKDQLKAAHDNRMAEITATGEQNRRTLRDKPAPAPKVPAGQESYDISKMVRTTQSGKRFVDLSELTGNAKNSAIKAAHDQGLPALGGDNIRAVKDIDRARRDLSGLENDVLKLVPRDPQGRLMGAAGRTIEELAQTNPNRAAYKSWRDAAIPTLRALVAGPGLRMSTEQLKLMLDNLPNKNDTWDTASSKLAIIRQMLDNAEAPNLDADWSGGASPQVSPGAPPSKYKRRP